MKTVFILSVDIEGELFDVNFTPIRVFDKLVEAKKAEKRYRLNNPKGYSKIDKCQMAGSAHAAFD